MLVLLNVLLLAKKWRMNGEVENVAEDKTPFQQHKLGNTLTKLTVS